MYSLPLLYTGYPFLNLINNKVLALPVSSVVTFCTLFCGGEGSVSLRRAFFPTFPNGSLLFLTQIPNYQIRSRVSCDIKSLTLYGCDITMVTWPNLCEIINISSYLFWYASAVSSLYQTHMISSWEFDSITFR